MTPAAPNKLLVIVTTGPEDRGSRATLAFAMGVSALIQGIDVTIYLTMGGTFWSREGASHKIHIEGFEPLADFQAQFMENGGKLMVCSPCDAFYCAIAKGSLIDGAERCGLGHIVDLAMGASVVTL